MKKVMLAAAIVCAAVMSHGAALQWKFTGTGADNKYNQVALINAADIATVEGILLAGGSDMLTELAKYEIGGLQTATKGGAIASKTVSVPDNGTGLSYAWILIQTSNSAKTITDGTTGYKISAAQTYAELKTANAIVSGSATATPWETLTGFSATGAKSGTIGDVPEPTSGLLLLIGMAGLALRRRRA